MIDPLTRLAVRHGTDKFGYHDYTPIYNSLLERYRDRAVKVLEIGVGGFQHEDLGGHSLAMWRDYFENGEITAIDIHKKSLSLGPRVKIYQGSQVDLDFLKELVAERGPFDIIIDDGSHLNEHVVTSFAALWPTLAQGGTYIIEDIQTAFFPNCGGSLELKEPNSIGMCVQQMFPSPGEAAPSDLHSMTRVHNIVTYSKNGPWAPASLRSATLPSNDHTWVESQINDDWRKAFAALPTPGALVLKGLGTCRPNLIRDLRDRFVEIDHKEMRIHFPKATIDPIAEEIFAMTRFGDDVVLMKRPNSYPSNFKFDADHPRVKETFAAMDEILTADKSTEVEGISNFAELLVAHRDLETAGPWIEKLDELDSTARVSLRMRIRLAQFKNDQTKLEALLRRATKEFSDDPNFFKLLADVLLRQGRAQDALEVVKEGQAVHVKGHQLHIMETRIHTALEDHNRAIEVATESVQNSPPHMVEAAKMALAKAFQSAGRLDDAETQFCELSLNSPRISHVALKFLSRVQLEQGKLDEAVASINRAVEIAPQNQDYRNWQAKLTAKAEQA